MLMANLNRQGYREIKLLVILVGAMGTIYKDYTDKPLADLNLDYHKTKKLTHKTERTLHHTCICTHKNKVCIAIIYKQQQSRIGSRCYGTQPP